MDKLLKEINELAHKSKSVGLTTEEKERQQVLRQEYLKRFREGFRQELEHVRVIDPLGNDVTPKRKKDIS